MFVDDSLCPESELSVHLEQEAKLGVKNVDSENKQTNKKRMWILQSRRPGSNPKSTIS